MNIYFDNAATTYPKPPAVRLAVEQALRRYGANPGRGGHEMAMAATEELFRCREEAAAFFGLPQPERVVFTLNCTAALNIILKSLLHGGGRAVISAWEHNAVVRPLYAINPQNPPYDTVTPVVGDTEATVEAFRRAITKHTRAIVCTHASNVFGCVLPVRELAELAHEYGMPLVVDAAQSAGVLPIDMRQDGIDYLCVAGHKGLYGPMGTGLLLCGGNHPIRPLIHGGTGVLSRQPYQPEELPERLESGTPNVVGLCGLRAGMQWVRAQGVARIAAHELALTGMLYRSLRSLPQVQLYTPPPSAGLSTGVLSFTVDGMTSEQTAAALDRAGVAVRAGLHCAPLAHQTFGTLPDGTVRISLSRFNTGAQTMAFVNILKKISADVLQF